MSIKIERGTTFFYEEGHSPLGRELEEGAREK